VADSKLYPPLAALRAFEAVGRLGGIRRAAKELTIDHAVVSRHIRSLEAWVGVPLVVRHNAGNALTPQGESFHQQIASALTIISNATGELMSSGDDMHLSVWCIPGFASLWLADRLSGFMAENPQIDVDFRPADESPDFRSKDVDCDIRYLHDWETDRIPRMVHRLEVARPRVFPVASREFVDAMPEIQGAEDLLALPLLHEESDAEWSNWMGAQGVGVSGRLAGARLWHAHLTLNAARQGQGVALANDMLLADQAKTGDLVRIEPAGRGFEPVRFGGYTLLAREDRWTAPEILRFRRWLLKAVSAFAPT
jgi:DNA-binding transcriptional LysR family regulator